MQRTRWASKPFAKSASNASVRASFTCSHLVRLTLVNAELERTTPSVSDYALVRRQFHIFERALKKFKSDVGLWIQYVQVAKKEGARSLVGRITARYVLLHTIQLQF